MNAPQAAGTPARPPRGYWQLIEGHEGGFAFTLRAGNHETILESRVFWSRQSALDAVDAVRVLAQDPQQFQRREAADGRHWFELCDPLGQTLARGPACATRAGLSSGIASVRRNAPSTRFRGLVRRALTLP